MQRGVARADLRGSLGTLDQHTVAHHHLAPVPTRHSSSSSSRLESLHRHNHRSGARDDVVVVVDGADRHACAGCGAGTRPAAAYAEQVERYANVL